MKHNTDHVFLVAGYSDKPSDIQSVVVISPNDAAAFELAKTANDGKFKPVTIASLTDMNSTVSLLNQLGDDGFYPPGTLIHQACKQA